MYVIITNCFDMKTR